MCLGVYLGTSKPVELAEAKDGQLGIERASWTPPPLARHEFVYYLGRKGQRPELECSCMFVEHVDWTEAGPIVSPDATYPEDGSCPFEKLRALCADATRNSGWAAIVSDDSGGLEQQCTVDDYRSGMLPLDLIRRGNLLFADVSGGLAWRVWHVVNAPPLT